VRSEAADDEGGDDGDVLGDDLPESAPRAAQGRRSLSHDVPDGVAMEPSFKYRYSSAARLGEEGGEVRGHLLLGSPVRTARFSSWAGGEVSAASGGCACATGGLFTWLRLLWRTWVGVGDAIGTSRSSSPSQLQ